MKRNHIMSIVLLLMLFIYPAAAQDTALLPGTDVSDRYLKCYSGFYEGRSIVFDFETSSRYCIDTDGKVVFVIPGDMGIGSNYINGLSYAVIDDTMVMIDRNGKTVIAPEIQDFSFIIASVPIHYFSDSLYGYTDVDGNGNTDINSPSHLLKAGYILVCGITTNFSGDTFKLGVLNTNGDWIMPLNDTCGPQERIQSFIDGLKYDRMPTMEEGKISAYSYDGLYCLLDPEEQTITVVSYKDIEKSNSDRLWFKSSSAGLYHYFKYVWDDGTTALDLNELYPTIDYGRNFVGDFAAVRFFSGSQYFAGVIDRSGKLVSEPVPVINGDTRKEFFYVLNDHMFYAFDPKIEKRANVYGFDSNLLFSLDGIENIGPFQDGLALVEQNLQYSFFINEAGERVIGQYDTQR